MFCVMIHIHFLCLAVSDLYTPLIYLIFNNNTSNFEVSNMLSRRLMPIEFHLDVTTVVLMEYCNARFLSLGTDEKICPFHLWHGIVNADEFCFCEVFHIYLLFASDVNDCSLPKRHHCPNVSFKVIVVGSINNRDISL